MSESVEDREMECDKRCDDDTMGRASGDESKVTEPASRSSSELIRVFSWTEMPGRISACENLFSCL